MKKLIIIACFLNVIYQIGAQNAKDSLTTALQVHAKNSKLPGFAVAIVNKNGVIYQKGFGYANKRTQQPFAVNTIQNLGSVSKTMVGVALVKAIEEGYFTLDTKINDLLPFPVQNPYDKNIPILIRHLATHTSSILDTKHYGKTYVLAEGFENEADVHEDFLGFLQSHPRMTLHDYLFALLNSKGKWYKKRNFLKVRTGTIKEYANLNAALAAYIIECATKMPFQEYTQRIIFDPLQLNRTTWLLEKVDPTQLATPYFPQGKVVPRYKLITYPDGGLYANVKDLSRFLQEIIKGYIGESDFLLGKYAQMLLPGDEDQDRVFWGMGEKSRNIGHGGSDPGVQTDLQFNADSKIGRIILCNVNAEDNEELWKEYRTIHRILAAYENRI